MKKIQNGLPHGKLGVESFFFKLVATWQARNGEDLVSGK